MEKPSSFGVFSSRKKIFYGNILPLRIFFVSWAILNWLMPLEHGTSKEIKQCLIPRILNFQIWVLCSTYGLILDSNPNQNSIFFYSDEWFDKGICNTIDLLNIDGPQPIVLTFDQLIEKFGISRKDRRFYNFLIKNIPCEWLEYPDIQMTMFLIFLCEQFNWCTTVPKYAYSMMLDNYLRDKQISFWKLSRTSLRILRIGKNSSQEFYMFY